MKFRSNQVSFLNSHESEDTPMAHDRKITTQNPEFPFGIFMAWKKASARMMINNANPIKPVSAATDINVLWTAEPIAQIIVPLPSPMNGCVENINKASLQYSIRPLRSPVSIEEPSVPS